ncbi:hypothetical protein LTR36_000052 [Oleoguttula mirabilis]|uniref:aminodeoxychorismate synthase n=1 Tax=Oleoguttula mirabilis TaxID=1507867 RepID=A0AAV9JXH1_9PEZI|nr:hypothetical protein LTR36_000052 [Oleoguttula mirabilis]
MPRRRILFIDAYDSFSNNITALLKHQLAVTVEVIKIDDPRFVFNDDAFQDFLDKFDAAVAGPGPGHPADPKDVGLIGKLWHLPDDRVLPVLGICLGFQSLGLAFGASIERLCEPRHGLVTTVTHCSTDVFTECNVVEATQYHSLHVRLDEAHLPPNDCGSLWTPRSKSHELLPLAWDLSDSQNGPILMGMRHRAKPFWGVQYHPESVCSTDGRQLIENWWRAVGHWNARYPRELLGSLKDSGRTSPESATQSDRHCEHRKVCYKVIEPAETPDSADVLELLRDANVLACEPILLESGVRNNTPVNSETGRFSIVCLPDTESIHIRWYASTRRLTVSTATKVLESRSVSISETFNVLGSMTDQHRAGDGLADIPFWGGLVGFISYEAGLKTIDVEPVGAESPRPDVWFVMAERSVVIDHVDGLVYVQSIRDHDEAWLSSTAETLRKPFVLSTQLSEPQGERGETAAGIVAGPDKQEYCDRVRKCQSHLRAGSSYELCLTDQTLLRSFVDPWRLYRKLRKANPAPFGAFLSLRASETSVSVVGSSPERFLSWSRDGKCQFRPIKGTVKKTPGMTKAKAEQILGSEKERAENLMIVDLIRHDLSGVHGIQDVQVPKLMVIEEYETVYQLVSVIEGQLDSPGRGINALAGSLPPGSMTGAPKKRSCELLQTIEGGDARGLYSGVLGYFDVGGGADFSVVIRTAFRWNEELWRVGAGGAITALSRPDDEWEEMLAKRESLLGVLTSP